MQKACVAVRDYLDDTLGRYIVNVTEAAFLCSQTVCSSNGRCIRRDPSGTAYLHLDPAQWSIVPRTKLPGPVSRGPSYVTHRRFRTVKGESSGFAASFRCQCFPGWEGEECQKPVPVEPFTWQAWLEDCGVKAQGGSPEAGQYHSIVDSTLQGDCGFNKCTWSHFR